MLVTYIHVLTVEEARNFYADLELPNNYFLFSSKESYNLAEWYIKNNVSKTAMEHLVSKQSSVGLPASTHIDYTSVYKLWKLIDKMPDSLGPSWNSAT
jgi:hypothetical protein